MASNILPKDLFNTSNRSSSTKKTRQRPAWFYKNLDYKAQSVEDRLYFKERRERDEMVDLAFQQYQKKYPKQWRKLVWEASFKYSNEKYTEPSEDDPDSGHIEWSEDTTKEATEHKHKGLKRPISPVMKVRQEKPAKGIDAAKKALCFGSLTPEE
ncbi:hypothetical protein EAE96_007123 [Botrytis aclada]|nr:hypothetical protein EAE96_007123 [Botrytis aclada]